MRHLADFFRKRFAGEFLAHLRFHNVGSFSLCRAQHVGQRKIVGWRICCHARSVAIALRTCKLPKRRRRGIVVADDPDNDSSSVAKYAVATELGYYFRTTVLQRCHADGARNINLKWTSGGDGRKAGRVTGISLGAMRDRRRTVTEWLLDGLANCYCMN